jgi:DNA-binding beta-propeller fold protein YncE
MKRLAAFALPLLLHAQAVRPPGGPTEKQPADAAAKLKSGPALAYKVVPTWPTLPKGMNFGEVSGVDVDRNGNVWVFNRGHSPVMQFDRSGKLLQSWTAESFPVKSSHGLRVGPDGNLWCVDVEAHAVFKLSPEGRILMVLGQQGGKPGNDTAEDGFNRPTNVAFRANGNIYVSDGYVNSRIVEFNPAGEFVRKWGTKGTGDGQLSLVHDVTVDLQGRVYVADRSNERIQIFDADGKYNRILKLNMEGQVTGVLSSWGKAPGKVDFAHSVAVDPTDGSIYVAEIKNWRVQKWTR